MVSHGQQVGTAKSNPNRNTICYAYAILFLANLLPGRDQFIPPPHSLPSPITIPYPNSKATSTPTSSVPTPASPSPPSPNLPPSCATARRSNPTSRATSPTRQDYTRARRGWGLVGRMVRWSARAWGSVIFSRGCFVGIGLKGSECVVLVGNEDTYFFHPAHTRLFFLRKSSVGILACPRGDLAGVAAWVRHSQRQWLSSLSSVVAGVGQFTVQYKQSFQVSWKL